MKKYIIILLSLINLTVFAQAWEAPAEEAQKKATFKFDNTSVMKGQQIYKKNCMSCHGTPTKKDYAQLMPLPGDVSEAKFKNQSDGSLFYKLQAGKGLMPSFKTTLSTKEKWQVIAYIRSFHEGYVQVVEYVDPATLAKIVLTIKQVEGEKFSVSAKKIIEEEEQIASELEVAVYLKRHFANMKIGGTIITDKKGYAEFLVSKETRADREGKIQLIAKATEYDGSEAKETFEYGIKNTAPSLIEERAFWNRPYKAPIPLQLLYFFGLFFFLGVAGYVVLRLLKLKNEK